MKWMLAVFLLPLATLASELTVASLNVNFANERIDETLEWLAQFEADVLLLQESTTRLEKRVGASRLRRYEHSWFIAVDEEAGGGFAVLSRLPLVEQKFLKKSAGAFGAQRVVVEGRGVKVQLVNIHLNPAPLPKPYSRASAMHLMMLNNSIQVEEIRHLLAENRKGVPVVMAGDLNSLPSSPAYKQLIQAGFVDAHLTCDTNAHRVATWGMNVDGHRVQGRLDYVFHDARFTAKSFKVVDCPYSDHALLRCVLEMRP